MKIRVVTCEQATEDFKPDVKSLTLALGHVVKTIHTFRVFCFTRYWLSSMPVCFHTDSHAQMIDTFS